MKLIIALGNPGKKYTNTRHNAGQILLDKLYPNLTWQENTKLKSAIAKQNETVFAKPLVYMNTSGEAVRKIVDFYKIELEDILVIHDDSDLELGSYKLQTNRGAAGHNGVSSIIQHLGTPEFGRLRIGIRPQDNVLPANELVLEKFTDKELDTIKSLDISQEILI